MSISRRFRIINNIVYEREFILGEFYFHMPGDSKRLLSKSWGSSMKVVFLLDKQIFVSCSFYFFEKDGTFTLIQLTITHRISGR